VTLRHKLVYHHSCTARHQPLTHHYNHSPILVLLVVSCDGHLTHVLDSEVLVGDIPGLHFAVT
jgi:hypothetical protein